MALVKGVNSYVTFDESEAYFIDRANEKWITYTEEQRDQALVTATKMLDRLSWGGYSAAATQPLAFPRLLRYFDITYGRNVSLDGTESEAPNRVKEAVYELAHHILSDTDVIDSTPDASGLRIAGSVSLFDIRKAPRIPYYVIDIIRPLLSSVSTGAIKVNY